MIKLLFRNVGFQDWMMRRNDKRSVIRLGIFTRHNWHQSDRNNGHRALAAKISEDEIIDHLESGGRVLLFGGLFRTGGACICWSRRRGWCHGLRFGDFSLFCATFSVWIEDTNHWCTFFVIFFRWCRMKRVVGICSPWWHLSSYRLIVVIVRKRWFPGQWHSSWWRWWLLLVQIIYCWAVDSDRRRKQT